MKSRRPQPRILLPGFEPFERATVNPSWEVARTLDGWECEGAQVKTVQLPCVFGRAIEALDAALTPQQPTLAIALGLAGTRIDITPERIADNAGRQPIDLAVVAGAPAAYFSTLPIKALVRDLRAAGVPASVSNSAGTFVCNHVFFALMHRLATRPELAGTRGGFVHLPCLPEQAARLAGVPSLALATQVEGLRVLLRTALTVRQDARESGGVLH